MCICVCVCVSRSAQAPQRKAIALIVCLALMTGVFRATRVNRAYNNPFIRITTAGTLIQIHTYDNPICIYIYIYWIENIPNNPNNPKKPNHLHL